eukprot:GILK01000832.1.p1 GENE.GILK01000832.1~~GILK01000832.1.p1  ORF type:complete len:509 (-),score=89.62 GILK01000832.1:164-1510(-)
MSAFSAVLGSLSPSGLTGDSNTLFHAPKSVKLVALSEVASRNTSPCRVDQITDLVRKSVAKTGKTTIIAIVSDKIYARSVAVAIARAFPLYSMKSTAAGGQVISAHITFKSGESLTEQDCQHFNQVADAVRFAGSLVDTPPNELNPVTFTDIALEIAGRLNVATTVIRGEELRDRGFGGLWGVGKASPAPPALVVLSHTPSGASKSVVWVGKGITYDTGGLSIKTKDGMPGMKTDMGGAATVLAAFEAAVLNGFKQNLHCVLCLAENSVGPHSTRPDDIITLYSGLTVEVNNTDAEGRLVLGDGVAYAAKHLHPDAILDFATLTGAQGISTGRRHAAILTNTEALESLTVAAGKVSGDLTFPILYAPELLKPEFTSEVADMKNSVKDRSNAQSSCAGSFIESHLGSDYHHKWMHVDFAYPVRSAERGTGFGVALLLELFKDGTDLAWL